MPGSTMPSLLLGLWLPLLGATVQAAEVTPASSAPTAETPQQRGENLSFSCIGCHRVENYQNPSPAYRAPKLVGQYPDYMVVALKAYRSGERSQGTMHEMGSSLSDSDILDLSGFLAGRVLTPGARPVGRAPAKVTQLCVACHGLNGIGVTAANPSLAGQRPDYLVQALQEYKSGERKHALMATLAARLSAAEMSQIADYYSKQGAAQPGAALRTVP